MRRLREAAILVLTLAAVSAHGADGAAGGGLVGWVENTHGAPVSGALISVFGRGLRGGSRGTLTDSNGQFSLPSLPAGSYTLRALGSGHVPAPPRRITVLPDRDATFTLNLTPLGEPGRLQNPPAIHEPIEVQEARWLIRHKRRSVLESRGDDSSGAERDELPPLPFLLERVVPDLAATVELMADAALFRADGERLFADSGPTRGALKLKGRLFDDGQWSVGGVVSEADGAAWRMAAEFLLEPGRAHKIRAGGGYGSRTLPTALPTGDAARLEPRGTGALFVQDEWRLGPRFSAILGARYSYIGFLNDGNSLDPLATLQYRHRLLSVRGTVTSRTVAPGGDLLTISTLSSAPSLNFARFDAGLRPERLIRYELAVDRALGPTTIGAHAFQEDVRDPLLNIFDDPGLARSHRIQNGVPLTARGMGLTVARQFGESVNGSVTYTYGRSWQEEAGVESLPSALSYRGADFHDVVARLETFIDGTDTRVVAFCRFNTLNPESDGFGAHPALLNTRFDIQLSQGLPFLQALTRADWEVLVAVRNLFYETSEGGALDEIAVLNPPKRVLGGLSIRF